MAIAYFTQWSEVEPGTPERLGERIGQQLGDQPPVGGLYHAEGPTDDGGWWAFDVWASADDYETFRQQMLQPALDEFNVPEGQVRQLHVHWDTSQVGGSS